VAIPSNDDTPISRHNKYVTITVCKGPIHKKCRNVNAMSNRFTSFDNKLITWPIVVSPRAAWLRRNAWVRKTWNFRFPRILNVKTLFTAWVSKKLLFKINRWTLVSVQRYYTVYIKPDVIVIKKKLVCFPDNDNSLRISPIRGKRYSYRRSYLSIYQWTARNSHLHTAV